MTGRQIQRGQSDRAYMTDTESTQTADMTDRHGDDIRIEHT